MDRVREGDRLHGRRDGAVPEVPKPPHEQDGNPEVPEGGDCEKRFLQCLSWTGWISVPAPRLLAALGRKQQVPCDRIDLVLLDGGLWHCREGGVHLDRVPDERLQLFDISLVLRNDIVVR